MKSYSKYIKIHTFSNRTVQTHTLEYAIKLKETFQILSVSLYIRENCYMWKLKVKDKCPKTWLDLEDQYLSTPSLLPFLYFEPIFLTTEKNFGNFK